jgi:pyrophosphatase PpaX
MSEVMGGAANDAAGDAVIERRKGERRRTAVLFDLDGTLVDSIALLIACMEHAFAGRTRRPSVPEWVALIGTPLDAMLRPWADGEPDVVLLRERYREYQLLHHDAMTAAYPGVVETVRALHAAGHPLGVVTSKMEAGARRALKLVGIEECFGVVVGIDATTKHKPEPEPVWYALEKLGGIAPADAMFVGDSTHDMRAGRAAGVATAAALWGPFSREQLAETLPTHWLSSMPELRALI